MARKTQQNQLQMMIITNKATEPQTIEEILEAQKRRSNLFPERELSPVLEMLIRDSGDKVAQLKIL